MSFSLDEIAAIAREVGREQQPALDVVAVTGREGDGRSAEVILTVRGCSREPCVLVVGIDRSGTSETVRSDLAEHLRRHVADHGQS